MGVHGDLVLPNEAAHAGDFRYAGHARQFVFEEPVLQGTQFAQVVAVGLEHVHERPADPGGVRPEGGYDPLGQLPGDMAQGFEDPGPRPVEVGAVLEDDGDEGEAEVRIAPDDLGERRAEQLRGQRVGHLVFDQARRLPRVLRVDDDLDIGEVGNRVERCPVQRVDADRSHEDGDQRNQEAVLDGVVD